ncbi:MAG: cyclic pyranopterin monophosphate synthase MoaC [Vicinamibacterales bacterium]
MKAKSKPPRLSHVNASGELRMVDVSAKPDTVREATATGEIHMSAAAVRAIRDKAVKKGDPLQAARLAGIMAAKRTSDLIPLCHPLAITSVDLTVTSRRWGYAIRATVRTAGPTGVEMEALTAVSVAALTIYDMLKAVDREMEIGKIRLTAKSGGRSGNYVR